MSCWAIEARRPFFLVSRPALSRPFLRAMIRADWNESAQNAMTTISDILVTPAYVRTMAAYNAEMNRRLYDAAARLAPRARALDRGAFWQSIQGTLAHILWGDTVWMSRFDGWPKPSVSAKEASSGAIDFAALYDARRDADARISDWAGRMTPQWLDGEWRWYSGAAQRELRMPKSLLVTHFFNHQTHHRGQAHAMITAAGEQTGDTDLFLVIQAPPAQ
jgi:uncharacterized damage-inducible protein DinB